MSAALAFAALGAAAGLLGSLVGVGGGIILIPCLVLFMDVPIHHAIAASLVAVIATSSTAAISYVRDRYSNMRLGMVLETATTAGALAGGWAASRLDRQWLSAFFSLFLLANALYLLLRRSEPGGEEPASELGELGGRYHDPALDREVRYRVRALPLGLGVSALAGAVSGLLGIGGGPIKVPLMTGFMGLPMKAAAATSNFMIGVTACASAALYYSRGLVVPSLAAPCALGVTAGALAGARLAPRLKGAHLSALLSIVLVVLAAQMGLTAAGLRWR